MKMIIIVNSATELRSIGREYVWEEVEFIPAHLKVRKIYRHAYECPTCKLDGADVIVKAETSEPVIPKSLASASSVAWLLHQKFELSLPFYRQEKEWERYGIALSQLPWQMESLTLVNVDLLYFITNYIRSFFKRKLPSQMKHRCKSYGSPIRKRLRNPTCGCIEMERVLKSESFFINTGLLVQEKMPKTY